uniref:C2H2-type domain-containing protein n=1 Tax=Anopheles coluzzii TaxID=1518534 RepID=A0A8W7P8W9_ANOCL
LFTNHAPLGASWWPFTVLNLHPASVRITMDGMCFDYDHYFAEETFIIDDFGEICEDVVRIAGASSLHLCKDFDAELRRQESPPPGGFNAGSSRCFDKEVSSLFSEMEYLTEVSPGTDVVLSDTSAITIAQEPAAHGNLSPPVEYQRILNNYIQKGRRKLEASSYSKMKASCPTGDRWTASARLSTSALETVTASMQPSARTTSGSSPAPVTAIVPKFDHHNPSASISQTVNMIQSSQLSPPFPSVQPAAQSRTASSGLLKPTRLHHCRDCGLSYASSESLRKHCCIIAEQYQCHLCLREFKKRKTLDHHMKSHDKVFSTDDDLRK